MSEAQSKTDLKTIAKRRLSPIAMEHLFDARDEVYGAASQIWQMMLSNRPNRPAELTQESTLEYTDGHLWIGLT